MTNSDFSHNQSDIERVVMRRIYRARVLRATLSGAVLSGILLLLALWGIGREVWVAMVFENGPQGAFGRALYLVYAFEHTRLAVQILSFITFASLVYLARATARALSPILVPARA